MQRASVASVKGARPRDLSDFVALRIDSERGVLRLWLLTHTGSNLFRPSAVLQAGVADENCGKRFRVVRSPGRRELLEW